MLYKTTSAKRVIAKVMTDLDLHEDTHRISDWIEWMGEALEKIGAHAQFTNKVSGRNGEPVVEITNYQARLPYDFHRLVQISYSTSVDGPFYPMRSATGSFERVGGDDTSTESSTEDVVATGDLVTLAMSVYDLSYSEALELINTNSATRSLLSGMINNRRRSYPGQTELSSTTDYVYTINDSYVKTNVEEGYLNIAYQAIPTDADNYPLIPDDASFLEALYWYIVMKILYPKWATGQVRDAVYYEARRSWNYYCKQAYGNAMMPDTDQMESVKNSWLRLVPSINDHDTFFSTTGEKETIWNHNRN